MLRYCPPKPRQLGRLVHPLTSTLLLERATEFIKAHCHSDEPPSCKLVLSAYTTEGVLVRELAAEIVQLLGPSNTAQEASVPDDQIRTFRSWEYSAESLPTVAAWHDKRANSLKPPQVYAMSMVYWIFTWRDEANIDPAEALGGSLGISLGFPSQVTPLFFFFRDVDHYAAIKAALLERELVELKDRHLRPVRQRK